MREVYDHAQAYPGPDPQLPETVQQSRRVKQQQYQQQLLSICKPYLDGGAPMRVLCQRVERFLPELFAFAADPRVQRGQQRGGAQPAPNGREPKDQWRDPFGAGKRNQECPRFLVRRGCNPYQALNSILSQSQLAPV